MATIYKRNNVYAFSFELYRTENGLRKKFSKSGFKTKKAAKEALEKVTAEIAANTFIPNENITFAKCANLWLEEHKKYIKESTFKRYEIKVKQTSAYFAGRKLTDIKRIHVQEYINILSSERSLANVSEFKVTLKQIFDFACKYYMLAQNPCTYIKIPPCSKKPKEKAYMEKETLYRFLDMAQNMYGDMCCTFFTTLAHTGMRIGELSALQWSDIDFEHKTISINKNLLQLKNKEYKITTPKTAKSIRTIHMTDKLLTKLKAWQHQQKVSRILNADKYVDNAFVFAESDGSPIFNYYAYNKCREIAKKIDVGNIHPHSFRHTHTSLLAEAGIPLEVIQNRLGHSNDKITREIYLHITDKQKHSALNKLNVFLS